MDLKTLEIKDWKQFNNINLNFEPIVTVLTGANGSGKTTILNLLSQHFEWNIPELATPKKDKITGAIKFIAGLFGFFNPDQENVIGNIQYSDNNRTDITIPINSNATFQLQIKNKRQLNGIYIPAYRSLFSYRAITNLALKKRTKKEAYQGVSQNIKNAIQGGNGQSNIFFMKETLLGWAISGFGSKVITPDIEQKENYLGFEEVLKKVLPETIGFNKFEIRNYEIVLETESGEFLIDAVSGGMAAIIDLTWQIYMYQTDKEENFTVLIDEIENHLHATLQRNILPDLMDAFPKAKFIVSTHSPLVVGSVKESNVYALRYNEEKRIFSTQLDLINKSKSASEILRTVLGVPFTMPIWVEEELKNIIEKYTKKELNKQVFEEMRNELSTIGLEDLLPQTLDKVVNNDKTE